jgi:phage terminase large subunit-like protein
MAEVWTTAQRRIGTADQSLEFYPKQRQFVDAPEHEVAFVGGIGSGKSIAGCARALRAAKGQVGDSQPLPVPNLGVITAPTYPMLRDATLRAFMQVAGPTVEFFNKAEGVMRLTNGSEILFRSTEYPDRLRGPSIAWWFGDEAAMYDALVWGIMMGRLRQFGQRGYAWIATTPRGRNWVWRLFVQDVKEGRRMFKAISADNVYLSPEIIEAWQQTYVGDFAKQELGGEFIAFEGLIYPEFRREAHVQQTAPERFKTTVAGVDWGFANPGVILVFGLDGDGRLWQVAEHYQRQRRVEEWVNVAKQARQTWGISAFYCDPSEPTYIRQFTDAGLPAEPATTSVLPGIQAVKNRLVVQADGVPRLLMTADCMNTMAEYESYQWAENRTGIKDQPVKANDHAMDATRYAVMGVDVAQKPLEVTTSRWA